MPQIAYTVAATFPNGALADSYLRWLRDGHLQAVLDGGAESGSAVRVFAPERVIKVESRYVFPSKEVFDRYVAEVAPGLRADGLQRFGPDLGVRMERQVGETFCSVTRTTPARLS